MNYKVHDIISMEELFKEIRVFVKDVKSQDIYGDSKWFINDYIQIYLRVFNKGWIPFGGQDPFLIIATVGVSVVARRQGVFTSALNFLESINPFEFIGVESVSISSTEIRGCLAKEKFKTIDGMHFYKHSPKLNSKRDMIYKSS